MDKKQVDSEVKELKDKLKCNRERQIKGAYNSDYYAKMMREANASISETKGWSGDRTRKWIGRIPGEVWYRALEFHTEKELLNNDSLFRKWFGPFLIN